MSKKYLIITEGNVTEPNFLVPLFQKYGFKVNKQEQINVRIDNANILKELLIKKASNYIVKEAFLIYKVSKSIIYYNYC